MKDLSNISKKRKCAEKKAKKSSCILPKNENQETRKVKRKRTEKININAEDVKDKETRQCDQKRIMNKAYVLDNSGGEGENKRAANRVPIGLKCLHFPSSLIGTSKEERFMLDVQVSLDFFSCLLVNKIQSPFQNIQEKNSYYLNVIDL